MKAEKRLKVTSLFFPPMWQFTGPFVICDVCSFCVADGRILMRHETSKLCNGIDIVICVYVVLVSKFIHGYAKER